MNCPGKLNPLWVVFFMLIATQVCWASGSKQPAGAARAKRTAQFPTRWVSQTTHNAYRVRIDGNVLRADQMDIPRDAARHGAYVRTECYKAGDKWIGTTSSFMRLEREKAGRMQQSNWCHLLTRTEILTVSPGRITGRAEALKRVDIPKCQILEKAWESFVWVPAK